MASSYINYMGIIKYFFFIELLRCFKDFMINPKFYKKHWTIRLYTNFPRK